MYISENFNVVNAKNATWTFHNPTVFNIHPRDQKIRNPKKATLQDSKKFQRIFLTFETKLDECYFQIQVTFPDDEELERRRKVS